MSQVGRWDFKSYGVGFYIGGIQREATKPGCVIPTAQVLKKIWIFQSEKGVLRIKTSGKKLSKGRHKQLRDA